jgi:peptide subunit release factor 1 (eRF1)
MQDLTDLLSRPGPFASVALNSPSATEDAETQLSIRWHNARRQLDEAGFPTEDLERLDATISQQHHGAGAAMVVFHPVGGESFVEHLDEPIVDDLAAVGTLPRLGPVIESRQRSQPHVVVMTDRTGADIIAVDSGTDAELVEVTGDTEHIQRSKPGGWSQRRFQQRAENQWESNAGEVAEQVEEMVRRLDAPLITVAGDVRAVGFLVEQLAEDLSDRVRVLEGQSEDLIAEETVRAVADLVARETRSVLERFREASGQGNAAVGPEATLEALTEGRVEVLLVHDDPEDDRTASFDPEGMWCATGARTKADQVPTEQPEEGRLVDVAIRSALLGDSSIRIVPKHGGAEGSLGALLRW